MTGTNGLLLAIAALALVTTPAKAAPPTVTGADPKPVPAASVPDPSKVEEAGTRFRRGVELYSEGDLSAALVEFSRAYELVPRYRILYNIGQITYQQQDYLTTLRHFRRYLLDGGDDVPPARRRDVQQEIHRLEQRIGRMDVQAAPDTRILVDGQDIGVAPLPAPVEANVGRRHVEAISPAGDRWGRFVDLAGGDAITVVVGATGPRWLRPPGSEPRHPSEDAPMLPGATNDGRTRDTARDGRPWLAWTATAILAAGAGVSGALAWSSARDLKNARDAYPAMTDDLARLHDRTRTLSWVADGALAGAAVMAGISAYLTWRTPPAAGERDTAGRLTLQPLGAGLAALAWF